MAPRLTNHLNEYSHKQSLLYIVVTTCLSSLRAKYHKLKYGTELVQGDMNPPVEEGGEEVRMDPDAILSTNTNVSWKQSRHLLRQ